MKIYNKQGAFLGRLYFNYPTSKETHCIFEGSEGDRLEGQSRCSAHDNYNKKLGRELAMVRCLQPLSRETRRAVWQSYFVKIGKEGFVK